jgi:hypothetical protein
LASAIHTSAGSGTWTAFAECDGVEVAVERHLISGFLSGNNGTRRHHAGSEYCQT